MIRRCSTAERITVRIETQMKIHEHYCCQLLFYIISRCIHIKLAETSNHLWRTYCAVMRYLSFSIASICVTMRVQLINICIYSRKCSAVYFRELPIEHGKSCFFWHAEKKTMISLVAFKFFRSSRNLGHFICFLHQKQNFNPNWEVTK